MSIRFDRHIILQTAAAAALLVFAVAGPAFAQNNDTNGRISRIENEIQTLSRAVFKGDTAAASAFGGGGAEIAETQNRLTQIERDLQTLTGRVEEMSFEINRLKNISNMAQNSAAAPQRPPEAPMISEAGYPETGMTSTTVTHPAPSMAGKLPSDGGFTMTDPEGAASANAPSAGQLGTMSASPDSPTVAYESAFALLRNQDYVGAQAGFDAFIKANPDHALVPNALYWLGETYYVRNEFDQATRIFAESYRKYPKGAKAPDSLLKLAMSLNGMGKAADACVALGQLKKEYPAGAAPVLTRADQEIERLKCKSP